MRLEVEKLRRMEGDWIKVTVQMLDHIYAIFRAAERSGQQTLITQLGQFQNACRDVARRMGLAPFMPVIGEAFDARAHQLPDPKMQGNEGAAIQDVMACGYTYQGQLLRRALVVLEGGGMSSQPEAFPGGQEEPSAIGDPNQIHPEPTVAAEEFQRQSPQEPIRELGEERAETTSESQPERVSEVFEEVEISERIVDEEGSVTHDAPEETSGKADAVEEAAPRRGAKKKSPQDELPF